MPLEKIEHDGASFGPIYEDVRGSRGFYRIIPGYPAYVCLDTVLLEGNEAVHQFVFKSLLNYHNSIPPDSKFHATGLIRYFEELAPPEAIPSLPAPELAPEVVGRAVRVWRYASSSYSNESEREYRAIGKVG